MSDIHQSFKGIGRFIERNSTHILTGVAITGAFTTAMFAVEATPKALRAIEDYQCKNNKERFQVAWHFYIPAGITFVITATSIISMNVINERKKAALVGLYSIAQSTLKEYQAKVIETIGKKEEQKILDRIDLDRVHNNPPKEVIFTGSGEVLCLDSTSGRYFTSEIEKIRRTINEINRDLMQEMFIPLNDFYYELGLEPTELGRDLGFNIDEGFLEVRFSSQLTKDEKPCLVLNYEVARKT